MLTAEPRSLLRVAAIQMVSGASLDDNLKSADALLAQAAQQGAKLALLPEYFCLLGASDRDKVAIREQPGTGPIQQFLADAARRHQMWLVGGTMPLACDDPARVRNATLVFGPDGACAVRYDKIHLFGFATERERYDESQTIEAGRDPVAATIEIDGTPLRIGLSVCYDLRFPELYRKLGATQPLDLILMPAAFTATTGQAHWEVLLRARAIENQCYLLAAAQGGKHDNGRRTWGQSMLVDPWGEIVAQQETGPGVVCGELDFARLRAIRQQLPALSHRVL